MLAPTRGEVRNLRDRHGHRLLHRQQPAHREVIVRPRSVPEGLVRVRAKVQPVLVGPLLQPGQDVSCPRRWRRVGNTLARRRDEEPRPGKARFPASPCHQEAAGAVRFGFPASRGGLGTSRSGSRARSVRAARRSPPAPGRATEPRWWLSLPESARAPWRRKACQLARRRRSWAVRPAPAPPAPFRARCPGRAQFANRANARTTPRPGHTIHSTGRIAECTRATGVSPNPTAPPTRQSRHPNPPLYT